MHTNANTSKGGRYYDKQLIFIGWSLDSLLKAPGTDIKS